MSGGCHRGDPMKYAADRPIADPDKAARKLMEITSIDPSARAAVP